jgi:RHH-type rel operon transcriptional repressor/antitoxin RelB
MSTTFTMRLDPSKKALISEYAAVQGKSMSEFMTEAALDVIESETDLRAWEDAKKEFDANPVTHSNYEVMHEFGLR